MPVELYHGVLCWWGRDALPWQQANPDVLPDVHLWFSPCSPPAPTVLSRTGRQPWLQLGRGTWEEQGHVQLADPA